jgi:hypothetical protein
MLFPYLESFPPNSSNWSQFESQRCKEASPYPQPNYVPSPVILSSSLLSFPFSSGRAFILLVTAVCQLLLIYHDNLDA